MTIREAIDAMIATQKELKGDVINQRVIFLESLREYFIAQEGAETFLRWDVASHCGMTIMGYIKGMMHVVEDMNHEGYLSIIEGLYICIAVEAL